MPLNKVVVSAIQPLAGDASVRINLERAESLVREAKEKGAELVLLPEFLSTGYRLEPSIWNRAEPANGETAKWLSSQARENSIWLGTSFLEASGEDFFNTFILVNPEGEEVIRIRKSTPAATERFFFKGDRSKRVVDTPLGRIGISICYEGVLAGTMKELNESDVDFMLMPMSAPVPTLNYPLKPADIQDYIDTIRNIASDVAHELGVPTVMANKTGPWKTNPPWPLPKEDSYFPGMSVICDADGSEKARLGDETGVVVAEIVLDPRRKKAKLIESHGKWARAVPKVFNLLGLAGFIGKIRYALSIKRRRLASRISGR
jgi:N-carbamoylputrescine amidase